MRVINNKNKVNRNILSSQNVAIEDIDGKVAIVIKVTRAGMLFFGYEHRITRKFPQYFLDNREEPNEALRWTDRTVSNSGGWSGNLYDFFMKVMGSLDDAIKMPFTLAKDNLARVDLLRHRLLLADSKQTRVPQAKYPQLANP